VIRYHEQVSTCFLTFVKDIPGYEWKPQPQHNFIDELVDAKLQQLKFVPAGLCSDEEFLRRVYLDTIGLLPSVEETAAFFADPSPDKAQAAHRPAAGAAGVRQVLVAEVGATC